MKPLGPCNQSRGPNLLLKPHPFYKVAQVETRLESGTLNPPVFYALPCHRRRSERAWRGESLLGFLQVFLSSGFPSFCHPEFSLLSFACRRRPAMQPHIGHDCSSHSPFSHDGIFRKAVQLCGAGLTPLTIRTSAGKLIPPPAQYAPRDSSP